MKVSADAMQLRQIARDLDLMPLTEQELRDIADRIDRREETMANMQRKIAELTKGKFNPPIK